MVRTANQTATVYSMIVIIETDAIVQEEVIRSHLTTTCILINKPKIENKSVFICVSSTTEKNLHVFKLKYFITYLNLVF